MKMILTEKPSVAADFATALQAKKTDGFYKNDQYTITNCIGHLVESAEPKDYDPKYEKWNFEDLPIIPEQFKYNPIPRTKSQLDTVLKLVTSDLEQLIIATDAGREGELIARHVLDKAKFDIGKCKRFWCSEALTPDVILRELDNLQDPNEKLYKAGLARQQSDWLMGINLSRALSLKLDGNFSYGRVQTCILNMIVQRELEIKNFTKKKYYQFVGDWQAKKISLYDSADKVKAIDDAVEAAELLETVKDKPMTIASVDTNDKTKYPPALLNLTALQKQANNKFGYSATKTLELAQALYETKKCLSYPRTPSRVMGESNVDFVKEKLAMFENDPMSAAIDHENITAENKRIFNGAKLEDHHALVPLAKIENIQLSEAEKNIYMLVYESFLLALSKPFLYKETVVKIAIEGSENYFRFKGIMPIDKGFQAVFSKAKENDDDSEESENELDGPIDLNVGDSTTVENIRTEDKETKPPKSFTDSSLLSIMEHPNRALAADDDTKFDSNSGLGTPATRAAIIETLVKRELIVRNKKLIVPTDKGFFYMAELAKLPEIYARTNALETAQWEAELAKEPNHFYEKVLSTVREDIENIKNASVDAFIANSIGNCPLCSSPLKSNNKGNFCSSVTCKYVLWPEFGKHKFSDKELQALLAGETLKDVSLTSKAGKEYKANLWLDAENNHKLSMGFSEKESVGNCPICSSALKSTSKGNFCSSETCKYVLWPEFGKHEFSDKELQALLAGETLKDVSLTSKAGKEYKANLSLDASKEYKLSMAFAPKAEKKD